MSKTFYYINNSIAEFLKDASSLQLSMLPERSVGRSILRELVTSKGGFHGSWNQTIRRFKESDFSATASLTDQIINDLTTVNLNEVKWKFLTHQEEGDIVDVDRYVSGHDKCWNGFKRRTRIRNTVRIYLNMGGNSHRSVEELAVAGAVGVTFAELMESMGLSAEMWAVWYDVNADSAYNDYIHMVKIKSQNEYADMGMINWFLGDNGVFRNAAFRTQILRALKNGHDVPHGLGQSQTVDLCQLGLTPQEQASAIIVPHLYDIERAKKWLEKVLSDEKLLHKIIYQEDQIV